MKTFEGFIESDAFFPILIILLIILIAVFVWIVIANKQEEKKKRAQRQLLIDESAEIKIIDNNHQKIELKDVNDFNDNLDDEEPERNEIAIIQEIASADHDNNKNKDNKDNKQKNDNRNKEKENKKDDNRENEEFAKDKEFKKVDVSTDNENEDGSIKVPGLFTEEVADIENIDVHLNPEENEKVELELPMIKEEVEEPVEEVIKTEMTEEEKAIENAFALPDFDTITDEGDIEGEIIEAANKYIAEIMSKEED